MQGIFSRFRGGVHDPIYSGCCLPSYHFFCGQLTDDSQMGLRWYTLGQGQVGPRRHTGVPPEQSRFQSALLIGQVVSGGTMTPGVGRVQCDQDTRSGQGPKGPRHLEQIGSERTKTFGDGQGSKEPRHLDGCEIFTRLQSMDLWSFGSIECGSL